MVRVFLKIHNFKLKTSSGMSLVEVLMSVAIFTVIVSGMFTAIIYAREGASLSGERGRAMALAKEGVEAVRNMSWNSLSPSAPTYGLSSSGTSWTFSGTSDVTDGIFTRTIDIDNVETSGNIMHKDVTVTVTWGATRQRTVVQETRLSSWQWSWQEGIQDSALDLAGTVDSWKVKVLGDYAYVTRNAVSGNLNVVDISNPASPVARGSIALVGTPKNLVVGIINGRTFAFVATTDNSRELQIIDVTNPNSLVASGTYNSPGNSDHTSVDFDGTYVYQGYVSELVSLDPEFTIVNPNCPVSGSCAPSLVGSYDFGLLVSTTINDITVIGNYVYAATTDTAKELQVYNITNRASPTSAASLNITGNNAGSSINGYSAGGSGGAHIFIGTASTFFTVDATNPTAPAQSGSIAIGAAITDISKDFNHKYAFVASSLAGGQLKVINVNSLASPSLIKALSAVSALNGVTYDQDQDRAYAGGIDNAQELVIYSPR